MEWGGAQPWGVLLAPRCLAGSWDAQDILVTDLVPASWNRFSVSRGAQVSLSREQGVRPSRGHEPRPGTRPSRYGEPSALPSGCPETWTWRVRIQEFRPPRAPVSPSPPARESPGGPDLVPVPARHGPHSPDLPVSRGHSPGAEQDKHEM